MVQQMIFRKKPTPRDEVLPGLQVEPNVLKRVETIPSQDLAVWFESSTSALGVVYDQWVHHDGPEEEVTVALQALNAMWQEMRERGRRE